MYCAAAKTVLPAAGGADALLGATLIGSFPTSEQAQVELDRVSYELALHEEGVNSLTPFGIAGGPRPDLVVSDSELDAAHHAFCSFFAESPKVIERADRALALAKNRERLTIREDGSVTIQGSKRYQVSDQGCTCRDFFVRQAAHAGMCKHTIARELYRLAQASAAALHTTPTMAPLELPEPALYTPAQDANHAQEHTTEQDQEHTTEQDQEHDQTAFVELEARAFTRALLNISAVFDFGTCQMMRFRIIGSLLELEADGQFERVQGSDGSGHADQRHSLSFERDEFLRLWDAYRPKARSLNQLTLFISLADSTLFLSADTFTAVAQGVPPRALETA